MTDDIAEPVFLMADIAEAVGRSVTRLWHEWQHLLSKEYNVIVVDDDGDMVELENGGYFKVMRVSKLRELLAEIKDDPLVYVNRVGNLTLCTDDFGSLGIIDFNGEDVELFGQEDEL